MKLNIIPKHRKFGHKKDKFDGRDYLHKMALPEALPHEPFHTNVNLGIPSVRDQGQSSSCVGFGIGANLTIAANMQNVSLGLIQYISPTDIYNGARYIEGTLADDAGCYPRDALDWLKKKACLPEAFWSYIGFEQRSRPSFLDAEAAKYPLLAYYRVDNGTDGICSALASGFPVSIGIPWPSKWMNPRDGVCPVIKYSDSIAGGHEVCIYGYDLPTQRFYVINSWGKDWGNLGTCTIPFSAFNIFKLWGGYDAHYVEIKWTAPVPPEPPAPSGILVKVSADTGEIWEGRIPQI
jgi:hypothetical protein